jgi:hypothetical protein
MLFTKNKLYYLEILRFKFIEYLMNLMYIISQIHQTFYQSIKFFFYNKNYREYLFNQIEIDKWSINPSSTDKKCRNY